MEQVEMFVVLERRAGSYRPGTTSRMAEFIDNHRKGEPMEYLRELSATVDPRPEITQLLSAWAAGDPQAQESLFEAVYPDLRRLAWHRLYAEPRAVSLQPTELVHEVYLKFLDQDRTTWQHRNHFFAMASVLIRRILVDRARFKNRGKRGQGAIHLSLDDVDPSVSQSSVDILDLDRSLQDLADVTMIGARIVELRYFAGLTIQETAAVLALSRKTVVRKWQFAKAFIGRRLGRLEGGTK